MPPRPSQQAIPSAWVCDTERDRRFGASRSPPSSHTVHEPTEPGRTRAPVADEARHADLPALDSPFDTLDDRLIPRRALERPRELSDVGWGAIGAACVWPLDTGLRRRRNHELHDGRRRVSVREKPGALHGRNARLPRARRLPA